MWVMRVVVFFFSSRRRHTRCALVTGVQTCALPISFAKRLAGRNDHGKVAFGTEAGLFQTRVGIPTVICGPGRIAQAHKPNEYIEIGRASCRERVCQYV